MAIESIKRDRNTIDESFRKLLMIPPTVDEAIINKLRTAEAAPRASPTHCKAFEIEGPQMIAVPKK